jgi:hypothetical protein
VSLADIVAIWHSDGACVQHGRLFKSWIAAQREVHNVAESNFGRSQFKQLIGKLHQLPAMHARLFMNRIHERHNKVFF